MRFLRTNTAVIITVGPFYDKTDGVTIETALTITNERITMTADTDDGNAPTNILDNVTGATSGTSNDLNYITGNDAGMMQLELSAANVNRVGRMFLSITDAANHVPVFHEFMVLPAMIYDSFVAGTDRLDTNVTHVADTAQTARDLGNGIPAAVPGAAGGLTICGSNAATTFATLTITGVTTLTGNLVLSDGLTMSAPSTANRAGVTITGNGTGAGVSITSGNGATGNALDLIANSTNGNGLNATGKGTGAGLLTTGGASAGGDGIKAVAGGGVAIRGDITGNITGNLSGSVGSVTGAVGSVTARVTANTDQWAGGTIPAPNVTGVPLVDLKYIFGTILVEGAAGRLAGAFNTMYNVASPVFTTACVNQTGDSFARIGVAGAGLTNIDLPDQTMNITGNITGNLSGSVGSVTGNVGGNVVGSVASVVAGVTIAVGGIATTSFAAGAIDSAALATSAANEIADALLDRADAIETGLTVRGCLRLEAASVAGKLSGAATTTVTIRNAVADTKARITATVDADGNRSAITWDVA